MASPQRRGVERRGTSEVKADSLWAALVLLAAPLLLPHSAESRRVIPGPLRGPRGPASSEGLLLLVPPLFPGKLGLSEGAGNTGASGLSGGGC